MVPWSLFSNRQRNICGHTLTCPQVEYAASPCPGWNGSSTRLAACNRRTLRRGADRSHLAERDSRRLCQEDARASCCTKDEGRSFEAALQREASNSHKLLQSKAAVVNVMVKRRG